MTPPPDPPASTPPLPDGLEPLGRLARNLAWGWDEQIAAVLGEVDPEGLAAASGNPVAMLADCSPARLAALARDPGFRERLERAEARLDERLGAASWYSTLPDAPDAIAYFSPEFGLSEALPQYSGGLGILAGDHLKAASDLGVPIVGIGLFYRNGYFRQVLARDGAQREEFVELDPALLPMTAVRAADGTHVVISVPLPGATLHAALWRVDVGRVQLLLLDANVDANAPAERAVTDRLYGGDSEHRLRQEILLGIGGVKALAACGIEPAVFHMNEGHAGFLSLERVRALVEGGLDPEQALQLVRACTLFTTHTPVPAGIDRFSHDLMARYFGPDGVPTGLTLERLLALGAEAAGDAGVFNMAALGIRMAARVNGVSRLHGRVARAMFAPLFPGLAPEDVPITHVTNGVHAETWVGPEFGALYRARLGDGYGSRPDGWERLASVTDEELFEARADARLRLVGEVRRRLARQASERADDPRDSAWQAGVLDPQALTLGFARRVPTYKRLTLLLHDRERLTRLLTSAEQPVQLLVAGKAHPHDDDGKRLIQEFGAFAAGQGVRHRVIMLADYDMALADVLVSGVDVWLNTPLRPLEACGTSGMKAALNGVLNLSILDGWWDECFAPAFGWAIPSADEDGLDADTRDAREAASILDLIEHVLAPRFYERDGGLPRAWLEMIRRTICELAPQLLATRMLRDYVQHLYLPTAAAAGAVVVAR
ncbi:MAG: glycogen phosphorylase [Gaiellales bacterium]|jgi:starch phosphorylase|nr:glycogen phosphorylase [Gaiellales bacterium]